MKDVYPYDKILIEIKRILEDEVLTQQESKYIINRFNEIVYLNFGNDKNIDFKGKTFFKTEDFKNSTKQEISEKLQELNEKGVNIKIIDENSLKI